MRISFWSLGKSHESYIKPGVEDFTSRINRYYPCTWNVIAPPRVHESELIKKEGEVILQQLKSEDFLIALDERGKNLSSPQLASFIEQRAVESSRSLVFLIGGAYGIHQAVKERAGLIWSLSALTFPHQLVRLILAEQVYRACTIIRNEKYHHS